MRDFRGGTHLKLHLERMLSRTTKSDSQHTDLEAFVDCAEAMRSSSPFASARQLWQREEVRRPNVPAKVSFLAGMPYYRRLSQNELLNRADQQSELR
jgi:hypothetical protein